MVEKTPEFEKKCHASWQVKSYGGSLFKIKCRSCGSTLSTGGIPKCLHPDFREDKIVFTRSKKDSLTDFIKSIFKTN
jgi:ribosomal protein S27E